MSFKSGRWILVCLGVLLCAGCGDPKPGDVKVQESDEVDSSGTSKVSAPPIEGESVITSNDGTYEVRFVSAPNPIPLNQPFTLDVSITPKSTGRATGRNLSLGVDAVMPDHQHGMNTQPRIQHRGGYRFHIDGMLFHMAGRWELYFDITEGAVTERAQIDIHLE
ncbi:MAG: hypothetical protein ACE5EQ_00840 [Phycisphaerae bacterium]